MRKSFTRLFSIFMLFCMISLGSIAQAGWHNYQLGPDDGTCTVAQSGTFTITFNADVIPVKGGKISLNAANGTQLYPIQFNWAGTNPPQPWVYTSSIAPFGTVTFSGNKVTIDFKTTSAPYLLTELTNYYINVSPGSIKDAEGSLFPGILGTAPGSGSLSCDNDANYDWDFTVGDFTAPFLKKLTPKDEAHNVSATQVLGIKFNERMNWAPGKSFANLLPGDIALYTSTDPVLGQYGGDVIFTMPASVTVTAGDSINITWPSPFMPSLTNLFVRIKSGVFAEYQNCPSCPGQITPKIWEGFNGNGQDALLGDNGNWNFTTKDTRVPVVTITRVDCSQTSNYIITIDEGGIVTAGTMLTLTNSTVDQFVSFSGGAFDATVVNNPTSTVITVNPSGNLVSGVIVTVGLNSGLWDSSHNPFSKAPVSFTNGDYLFPVITASIVNPVGTSFDILAKSNETAIMYYVVIKKSDVLKSGSEYYKPTISQVYALANFYDNKGNPNIPAPGMYDDQNAGNQMATYFYDETGTANDKTVNIWQAGKFNINIPNSDVLQRVTDLPRTNGTDYVVYAYSIDASICGPYNNTITSPVTINGGSTVIPSTDIPAVPNGWQTGRLTYQATTSDVLPPVPTFTAQEKTPLSSCFVTAVLPDWGVNKILRDGPIYITFNESVRLADGTPITPASIEGIFLLENMGDTVGINTVTSFYDAATKKITLYPDSAFKSGSTVTVKLQTNKVEDMAGIERNMPVTWSFCVESYCEPAISWTADKVNAASPNIPRPILANQTLVEGNNEVAKSATIKLVFDQLVYAPADNEFPAGTLTQISNDQTQINWVGRFIKIREASSQINAPTGNIIYANGNVANFNITVNAYSGTYTMITITPAAGYEFGSEMWYNVEVEAQLQNAQRYNLISGICHNQANNVSFQITDHQSPTVNFFEANLTTNVQDLNKCVNCDTPSLDVINTNRIGVHISEWIALGFDGFRLLDPTAAIPDANALRRYFSLTKCDGTAIKFDMEDFSLDQVLDVATVYINPYDNPTENPNFVKGERYTVKFISNPNELQPDGTPYPQGAFQDDHGNLIDPGESCFKVYKEPVPALSCLKEIVLGTQGCKGVEADMSTFNVTLKFNRPMYTVLVPDPLADNRFNLSIWRHTAPATEELVGYIETRLMTTIDGGYTYTVNATNPAWVHTNDGLFVDGGNYHLVISSFAGSTDFEAFKSVDQINDACGWPQNSPPNTSYTWTGWNRLVIGNIVGTANTFKTGDATPPVLLSQTTGTIAKTANLVMTFSEKIVPVAGQVVNIYEVGTNTQVASVNVEGLNAPAPGSAVLTIPNARFNTFLVYNRTYYAQFNAGLVKDSCNNLTTSSILNKTSWTFTIGPDPIPRFLTGTCANPDDPSNFSPVGSSPTDYTPDTRPRLIVTFSEAVVPVTGVKINVYEGDQANSVPAYIQFAASAMSPLPGSNNKAYFIETGPILDDPSFDRHNFHTNKCYYVNIGNHAFKEEFGTQFTDTLVSFKTQFETNWSYCRWEFCIGDLIPPAVKFWPENNDEHVPLNAFLFGYLSEPVHFQESFAFTEANAMHSFRVERLLSKADPGGTLINFRLDAVGNAIDKQRIMITPMDPLAPDFGTTDNPTMVDDTWYRLTVINPNSLGYHLVDAAGNQLTGSSVVFHTEDILCPATVVLATPVTAINGSGFTFEVQLNEEGSISYTVVNKKDGIVKASGTSVTDATGYKKIVITGLDGSTLVGYDFDVFIVKSDNEIDLFKTDAQIMAEWPYAATPPNMLFGSNDYIRIRDLRPAPNVCAVEKYATVKICDNDVPLITGRTPAIGFPDFPVADNITFTLNEPVAFSTTPPALTPNQIALRDFENNLEIPAAITLAVNGTTGVTTVTINPTNPLSDQHRYYVTWDRYAMYDDNTNHCAGPNYVPELIDKTWWFKTKDNTPPEILCNSLLPIGNCVDKDADLKVTVRDGNLVSVNPLIPFIDIYEVGSAIPHERVTVASATRVDNGDGTYTFTFPTVYFYLSDKCYTAAIPAGLFKDVAGNLSITPGCTWNFCAKDYEAPVASWRVVEDFSYLYNVITDPQYQRERESGDVGESVSGIPTSSFIRVIFNEDIMVLDTVGVDKWRSLPATLLSEADIAKALIVKNVTDNKVLVYGTGFWVIKAPAGSDTRFVILINDDYSHIGYGGIYLRGSMKSNSEYRIDLKKNWISDDYDDVCETQNIFSEDVNLLTFTTRNDTPPQLTLKDANGAPICDAKCSTDTNFGVRNMLQPFGPDFRPDWPGQERDTVCNSCVAPADHITLEFNKPVVKTPTEILNADPFWWEDGGVDWWTSANLGLNPQDFINPATSRFIRFQRKIGSDWVSIPALDHVTITNNQTINLYWKDSLVSEGTYAITFAPYTVKDQIRVPDGNEFLGLTCIFKVVDHLRPTVDKFNSGPPSTCITGPYPMDVDTNVKLSILFNEPVQAGAADKKLIIRRENGQQQQIVLASQITIDPDISYNNRLVWINNVSFEENTLYYVEIEEGFVTDRALCGHNGYIGIDPEDSEPGWQALIPSFEWVFKTGDNTPPEPISFYPNNQNNVPRNTDLSIVFDENISTDCICPISGPAPMRSPMTWEGTSPGNGFYIYADNGSHTVSDFGNFIEFIPWSSGRVRIFGTDIYNGLTSDSVVIDPVTEFQKNMTYYIRVSDDMYCDGYKNFWGGIGDSTTWKFTITNDVAPEIKWTTPDYQAVVPETLPAQPNGYVVADLKMAFRSSEAPHADLIVKRGIGKVKIFEYIYNPVTLSYEEKLWKTININDPSVIFEGNLVTLKNVILRDDVNPLSCNGPRMYYVTVSPGAITNGFPGSLTFWEGFNDAFDWRFYTGPDNIFMMPYQIVKPVATNLSIADASTLEINFAENIEAIPGTTAKVRIFKAVGDVPVADPFTVVNANIFGGNTLKLVTNKLVDETAYYVLIDNGAVGDTSSCSTLFPGIADKTVWTFSTGDNTKPVPVLATTLGACQDTCITLTFNFNETNGVTAGAGKINLLVNGVIFASQPAVVGLNVNTITATFCNLPDKTVFTVSMDAGTVTDNGNNHLANLTIADPTWTFATGDNTNPVFTTWTPVALNTESSVTIVVGASEAIVPVALKKIVLSSSLPARTFNVTDMVTTDGGLTYSLVVPGLADKTTYTVTIDAGAFHDLSCNPNVTAVKTWSFATDDNTPPEVIATTPVQGAVLPTYIGMGIDFTFNEAIVAGTGNITVTRGTNVLEIPVSSDKVVVDGIKVTLVLTDRLYFGIVSVSVPQGAFKDLANQPNDNVAKSWTFSIVDTNPPNCLTIISPIDGQAGVLKNVPLKMEFCERMAPGDPTKMLKVYNILEVQGELSENDLFYQTPITVGMIDGKFVSVPLAGLADNTSYTVMIDADALRDEAGNPFKGIDDPSLWNFTTGDNTPPTIVSVVPDASSASRNPFNVNIEFSEDVVNVLDNVTVNHGTIVVTGSGKSYVAAITAADGVDVVMTIGTGIKDASLRNNLAEAHSYTYTMGDNTLPTVTFVGPVPTDKTARDFNVVLTFSEKVTGVEAALAGSTGMTGLATTDDIVYTVSFSGVDGASLRLVLDKTKVSDVSLFANKLFAGLDLAYTVGDHINPIVTADPPSGVKMAKTFTVNLTFSADAIVDPVADITVTGGTAVKTAMGGNVFKVDVTAADLTTVTITAASTIADGAGNLLAGTKSFTYVTGDNTLPTLVTVLGPTAPVPTSFIVSYTFSEPVTGFDKTSVTAVNGTIKQVVGSGINYMVSVTAEEKASVVITVSNNAVVDLSGNKFAGKTTTIVVGDFTGPTVEITDPVTPVTTVFFVRLKFNEPVTGVSGGVIIAGGKMEIDPTVIDGNPDITRSDYTLTVSANEQTPVTIVLTDVIRDLSDNKFDGPVTLIYTTGDFTNPELVTWSPADGETIADNHPTLRMSFTENVLIGAGGSLKIYKVNTTNSVLDIPITAEMINGKNVTVSYAATQHGLDKNIRYYVLVDGTALQDNAGNAFDGVTDASTWTFKTGPNFATDVPIVNASLEFKVYPNPFVEYVNVDNASKLSKVVVTNVAGQVVKEVVNPTNRIQLNELRSGFYFISLYNKDNVITKTAKIVKR